MALRNFQHEADWWKAPWLADLSPGAKLAYSQLHSYCATYGRRGLCPAIEFSRLAETLGCRLPDLADMMNAAISEGVVALHQDCWVLIQWELTQVKGSAARMRKMRAKLRGDTLPGDVNSDAVASHVTLSPPRKVTPSDAVASHVTLFGDGVTPNVTGEPSHVTVSVTRTRSTSASRMRTMRAKRKLDREGFGVTCDAFGDVTGSDGQSVTCDGVTPRSGAIVTLSGSKGVDGEASHVTPLRNVNVKIEDLKNVNVNVLSDGRASHVTGGVTPLRGEAALAKAVELVILAIDRFPKFRGEQPPENELRAKLKEVLAVASFKEFHADLLKFVVKNGPGGTLEAAAPPPMTAIVGWYRTQLPRWQKRAPSMQPALGPLLETQPGGTPLEPPPVTLAESAAVDEAFDSVPGLTREDIQKRWRSRVV